MGVHRGTQGRFEFSDTFQGGKIWLTWWPKFTDGDATFFAAGWAQAIQTVRLWIAEVKKNHDAPDLWAEAQKARQLTDAAGHVDEGNTPFSLAEIELLKPKLNEVEAYIESRQPLDDQQKKIIRGRFQYLLNAAKRGLGRLDWLNIFVSQIVQIFMDGVLNSSLYVDVMRHATTAVGSVLKLGSRLLGT